MQGKYAINNKILYKNKAIGNKIQHDKIKVLARNEKRRIEFKKISDMLCDIVIYSGEISKKKVHKSFKILEVYLNPLLTYLNILEIK